MPLPACRAVHGDRSPRAPAAVAPTAPLGARIRTEDPARPASAPAASTSTPATRARPGVRPRPSPAEPRDPPRRARPSWPCRPAERLAPRSRPSPLHMLRLSGAARTSQLGLPPPAPAADGRGPPGSSHSAGCAGERP